MIFLSAPIGTLGGTVVIKNLPNSQLKSNSARVIKVATLDGGTVVNNLGTTILDSELKISAKITKDIEANLWALFYGFTNFILVTGTACYLVAIKTLKTDAGNLNMNLIIISDELEG